MKRKAYFTFGQCHEHIINGVAFDKDCVVEIESSVPRQVMFDTFGNKWAMQYDDTPPDMSHFPRGIIKLQQ
jgi:hypothetical protein